MQLNNALILLLTSTVTAVPISKRTAATVLGDISTISSDVATLTSDTLTYTGSIIQSIGLATTVNNLNTHLTTTTRDTIASGTFNGADSASILSAVQALAPRIVTVLGDLDAKVGSYSSIRLFFQVFHHPTTNLSCIQFAY